MDRMTVMGGNQLELLAYKLGAPRANKDVRAPVNDVRRTQHDLAAKMNSTAVQRNIVTTQTDRLRILTASPGCKITSLFL